MAEYKENYPRGQQDCCLPVLGTEDVVAENSQQQVEMLEGNTEMDALADHGFFPGISKEAREKIARSESMAIRISNVANMVHFAAKVYASVRSGSLAIIASTLDSLLDLLSGFILWFTAFSLQTPNPDQYPIGKKLMQPLAIFALGVARHASPPWRQDNKDGHYTFVIGENLTPRYRILSKLGEGTFGQVLECWDVEKKEAVAIKVASSAQNCCKAAMFEIDVLQKLAKHDLGGSRCVQMRNWFGYRNHICIVFEKLGPNLYDFVRKNTYRSFPIDLVRELGRQLLESVACMHDLRLIHTDLKPENILLVSAEYVQIPDYKEGSYFKNLPKSSAIKLIDFGSTEFEHQDNTYLVTTPNYRAPEVILGMGWNCPCDLWSVGCILFELCSGKALFQPLKTLEHLAMMERVLGPLPQHMVRRAYRRSKKYYFRRGLRLNWPQSSKYYFRRRLRLDWPQSATSHERKRAVYKLRCLPILVMQHVGHSAGDLINLLQGLLRYDPNERLKAREALGHPFFTRELTSSGCTM